jgi:hypothetical protein
MKMKTIYSMLFILIVIYLILLSNKSHAVDIEFQDGSTTSGLTPGQLQNVEYSTIKYITFYPSHFSFFSDYPVNTDVFTWYGHPGSVYRRGLELSGDISAYQYLISEDLNRPNFNKFTFKGWFARFPSEPYPAIDQPEDIPPLITLLGSTTVYIIESESFNDPGATAFDQIDGDVTSNITISGSVNTDVIGTYVLFYNVTDSDGNAANQVSRSIIVNSADVQNISTDQLEKLIITIALTGFALAGFTTGMTYRFDS